jgi:DNA-binding XRE family transcriptional regulator
VVLAAGWDVDFVGMGTMTEVESEYVQAIQPAEDSEVLLQKALRRDRFEREKESRRLLFCRDNSPNYILYGITCGDIAKGVGLSPSTMHRILHGKMEPKVKHLLAMAEYFSRRTRVFWTMDMVWKFIGDQPWKKWHNGHEIVKL